MIPESDRSGRQLINFSVEIPGSSKQHQHTCRKLAFTASTAILLLCTLCAGCGSLDHPKTARANFQQVMPVSVATVQRRSIPIYLTGLGSVTAFNTVNVKSRVDGQLVQVAFREGQHVNKGDLLAVIDPRPYQVALSQAQATLFKDQAQLKDARLNYERYKGLLQLSGAMSQQQVDTQEATVDELEGQVRTDQANIDNAKLNLSYCRILAPVSGRVGLRLVDAGNMVHATDTNSLLVITQLQPIAILFNLPEDQLPEVAKQMALHTLEVDAYSRDDRTKLSTGKLLTIDNQIDPTTGTGKLKAVFENPDDQLWPNQFVNVRLLLETRKDSLVVPAAAVQRGPNGNFVYVVNSDQTVAAKPVEVAVTQNNTSILSSGVSAGDVVVTDGQDKLQNGSKVVARTQPPSGHHQTQNSDGNQNSSGNSVP
jgi:membrane fusion protein, multidrug efflux system